MPGLDLSTAASVLKEDYRGPVISLLNSQTILLKKLERDVGTWSGLEVYVPVRKGRNVGTGARVEGGNLPTAGKQQYDKLRYNGKYNYCRIQLTGPVIASMAKDKGSFIRAIDSEVKGALRDSRVDINRQMFHDGSSILTRCKVTSASTSVQVESTKFLKVGMEINVLNGADGGDSGGGAVGNRTVDSITDSDTFVISGAAITTDANDVVIGKESRAVGAWGVHQEMWGLEALISNANPGNGLTDLVGLTSRTGAKEFQANVLASGGTVRALDLDLMQQAEDQTEIEGEAEPGLILTNHAGKRRYAALLQADKRYPAGGEITLDGGYKALEFNGTPLVADKDASLTLTPQFLRGFYFLTLSSLSLEQLSDWDWMDKDGAILARVSGVDSYEATLRVYQEFCVWRANANAFLGDIDENP